MLPNNFEFRAASIWEILSSEFEVDKKINGDISLANERLNYWMKTSCDGDELLFNKKIKHEYNLNYNQLKTKLSKSKPKKTFNPNWLIYSKEFAKNIGEISDDDIKSLLNINSKYPFFHIVISFVNFVIDNHFSHKKINSLIKLSLKNNFLLDISNLLSEILFKEFISFKKKNKTSTVLNNHYNQFVTEFIKRDHKKFFGRYPVCLRLIGEVTSQFIDSSNELITRIFRDELSIKKYFNIENDTYISDISALNSDKHNDGRSVFLIKFKNNFQIIYKPKDLTIDQLWNSSINIFNEKSKIKIHKCKILKKNNYGYVEYINHNECKSIRKVREFYKSFGALLGYLHLWGASDMHGENIIACESNPYAIDVEMLLQPLVIDNQLLNEDFSAEIKAREKIFNSILQVGILPSFSRFNDNKIVAEGGIVPMMESDRFKKWVYVNTNDMNYKIITNKKNISQNIPKIKNKYFGIDGFQQDFIKGIRTVFNICKKNFDEKNFYAEPQSLKKTYIRKVFKPTKFYSLLIQKTLEMNCLIDGCIWSANSDFVCRFVDYNKLNTTVHNIAISERNSILKLNVPFFHMKSDGISVYENKRYLGNLKAKTGLSRSLQKVSNLKSSELNWQVNLAKFSIYQLTNYSSFNQNKKILYLNKKTEDISFYFVAEEIAKHLILKSIKTKTSMTWIGYNWLGGSKYNQLQPLSYDLYDGVIGIALFLSAFSKVSGNEKYYKYAKMSLSGLLNNIYGNKKNQLCRRLGLGLLFGISSIIYGLITIGKITGDLMMINHAVYASRLISDELISNDKQLDLAGGLCGSIIALVNLYEVTKKEQVLKLAEKCADNLLKKEMDYYQKGQSWSIPQSKAPLTGLSHGSSGFLLAFVNLNKYLSKPEYIDVIEKLVNFEKEAYDGCENNWPDFRHKNDKTINKWQSQWCHGSIGIGLVRSTIIDKLYGCKKDLKKIIKDDLNNAINSANNSWPKKNDTVCCGSFGLIDFLLEYSYKNKDPKTKMISESLCKEVIDRVNSVGYFNWYGNQYEFHYGFFRGYSGIGYTLLRQIDHDLPCVTNFS